VTRYQWLVLFVAWLGWVFDAMDATIYAIVLHPALHDLLHTSGDPPTAERIGWYGGIIFSIFLIGWAIGGIAFGIAADRFGRTKVLMATIIIYAGFTGAAALAESGGNSRSIAFSPHSASAENGRRARRLWLRRGQKRSAPRRLVFYRAPGQWDFSGSRL
jgi:MFS family permease